MERDPEPVTWKTLAGFAVLGGLLVAVAAPIALWVGTSGRSVVIRIAVAFFCAVVVHRLLAMIRHAALVGQPTAAEIALAANVAKVDVDPVLQQLAKEIHAGLGLRWVTPALRQRVLILCRRRGVSIDEAKTHLASWQEIEEAIRRLEEVA